MLLKTLPGLGIALIIGIIFCLPGNANRHGAAAPATQKWTVAVAQVDAVPGPEGTPFFSIVKKTAASRLTPVSGRGHDSDQRRSFAAAEPVPAVIPETFAVHHPPEPPPGRFAEVASATARRGNSPASATAFASVDEICQAETSAWVPTSGYPELPAKGIETWAAAKSYRSKQKEPGTGWNYFSHDGAVYSLGVRQDWSVDSVIGASIDILDAEVKGRYDGDLRKNDITGYFANAHYQGTFLGRYPVELKGTYGRMYHKGEGSFVNLDNGMEYPWHEKSHRSHYYGFLAKAGAPLLFAGVVKILPEFGVDYRQVKTSEFDVDISGNQTEVYRMDAIKSESLAIPVSVTVKRDFRHTWGLVTPRVKVGLVREYKEGATGVRALNSASASRVQVDPVTGEPSQVWFDRKKMHYSQFAAGMDVRTVGGWNVSAEYNRDWGKDFTHNEFKLELGRCF